MFEHANRNVERGAATRAKIIETSTTLFSKDGYVATSIEKILEATGVSRGAFYHHFKSKEQIFEAVFIEVEKEVTRKCVEQARGIDDPLERLRTGCGCFIQAASETRFRQIGLVDAPVVLGWEQWRSLEEQFGLGLVRAGLQAAASARGRTQELAPETAPLLLAALIEAALIVTRSENPEQSLSNCRLAVDKMLQAMVAT
jgi:AcrR family transcriptional regulator